MKHQKTSRYGIDLIKGSEQCFLTAYLCPAGVWTIGWGHTKGVKKGDVITFSQAEAFLLADLADCELVINSQDIVMNQYQFDALVDFVFNEGVGNFLGSTLLKVVKKNPNDPEIAVQLRRWVYADGSHDGKDNDGDGLIDEIGEKRRLGGLATRREAEIVLYFKK